MSSSSYIRSMSAIPASQPAITEGEIKIIARWGLPNRLHWTTRACNGYISALRTKALADHRLTEAEQALSAAEAWADGLPESIVQETQRQWTAAIEQASKAAVDLVVARDVFVGCAGDAKDLLREEFVGGSGRGMALPSWSQYVEALSVTQFDL